MGTPVFWVVTPVYQLLFFKSVKYSGYIGRAFSCQDTYFTLSSTDALINGFENMELFSGEIEWLKQPIDVISWCLGGETDAPAEGVVLTSVHGKVGRY